MKVCRIIILMALISQPLMAEDGMHFELSPSIRSTSGHSTYTMDNVLIVDDSTGEIIGKGKSKLEFPLNTVFFGIEFREYYEKSGQIDWFTKFAYYCNIDDTIGLMKDHDWITPLGYSDFKWSYTESDADFSYNMITFQVGKRIYSWNSANTYGILGFVHQDIEQEIINFRGWQYDIGDTALPLYHIDTTIRGMYYKVTYNMPMIGLLYNVQFSSWARLNLTAAYMHVFASDVDNHQLRNKTASANGAGPGFFSSLEGHLALKIPNSDLSPFIDFEARFLTLKVSTGQTQEWYGDDPASDDDETGYIIKNIPHEFSSLQFTLGVRIGLAF